MRMSPTTRDGNERLWVAVLPLAVWALHMLVCYIAAALVCGRADGALRPALTRGVILTTVVAVGLIMAVFVRAARRPGAWRAAVPDHAGADDRGAFIAFTTMLFAGVSLLGVIWITWSMALVGGCG